jgi:DNA-binding PadR family transcriptional regulator
MSVSLNTIYHLYQQLRSCPSITESSKESNYTSYIGKDMSILVILSLLYYDGVHSGYSMVKKVKKLSNGLLKLRAGTIYSQIEKLLEDGYVEQSIRHITDKKVKAEYSLTSKGIKKREKMIDEWNETIDIFENLVKQSNEE